MEQSKKFTLIIKKINYIGFALLALLTIGIIAIFLWVDTTIDLGMFLIIIPLLFTLLIFSSTVLPTANAKKAAIIGAVISIFLILFYVWLSYTDFADYKKYVPTLIYLPILNIILIYLIFIIPKFLANRILVIGIEIVTIIFLVFFSIVINQDYNYLGQIHESWNRENYFRAKEGYFPSKIVNDKFSQNDLLNSFIEIFYNKNNNDNLSSPLFKTDENFCQNEPIVDDSGKTIYPIDPQYTNLSFLGQIFTQYSCGRVNQVWGVKNGSYTLGSSIELSNNSPIELTNILIEIGYSCLDPQNTTECKKWQIKEPIIIEDLIKLQPYSNYIISDDCINCG